MKRYLVDEVPVELKSTFSATPVFTIFDTESEQIVATLELDGPYGCILCDSRSQAQNSFESIRAALASVCSQVGSFDLPDVIFERLSNHIAEAA
jgi:hypothetical protein